MPPRAPSRIDATAQETAWRRLLEDGSASRTTPFAKYEALYRSTYQGRDPAADGPGPAWFPRETHAVRTNLGRWMADAQHADYRSLHTWSHQHRDEFWLQFLQRIRFPWKRPPSTARDPSSDVRAPRWLPEARFNIADVCLRGDPERTAIVYGREGSERLETWTHDVLRRHVDEVAAGLDNLKVGPRDRIALYLPMTPEAVAIYLAVVRSGRVVVGIADASAAPDVAKRCALSQATLVFTVDSYTRDGKQLRVYEKAKAAGAPRCIVLPADDGTHPTPLRDGDLAWTSFLARGPFPASAERTAEDESNILFSSGTTKDPKALVWTHSTPIKCLADAYLHQDVQPDDVLAWPTSYGWMMGPWLTYASLGLGATLALYNGSPLVPGFGRFIEDARVTLLGVVPKIVKAWRQSAAMEPFDWSRIRRFSSTGETSDPDDMLYLMWLAGTKPVIEYCGGTEIGGGYVTGTMVQPAAPATFTTPTMGIDFLIVDDAGRPTRRGEVALVPPSIGLSNRILNYEHGKEYFEGFHKAPDGSALRRHGDQLERLGGGFIRHHGRMDDMINLNGVKTSVEELRGVIGHHPLVADTKPIAVDLEGKGQRVLVVYAVPKDGGRVGDRAVANTLRSDFSRLIKERLNPLLSHIHDVVLVAALPQAGPGKTRTQKEFVADYLRRVATTTSSSP